MCESVALDNEKIKYVNEIKYLGITIKNGSQFHVNCDHFKRKFYRSFNAIYCKSKANNSELVSAQLMQSYCMPMIFYSIEALKLNKSVAESLDNSINMALSKIFNTYDSTIIIIIIIIIKTIFKVVYRSVTEPQNHCTSNARAK